MDPRSLKWLDLVPFRASHHCGDLWGRYAQEVLYSVRVLYPAGYRRRPYVELRRQT